MQNSRLCLSQFYISTKIVHVAFKSIIDNKLLLFSHLCAKWSCNCANASWYCFRCIFVCLQPYYV